MFYHSTIVSLQSSFIMNYFLSLIGLGNNYRMQGAVIYKMKNSN